MVKKARKFQIPFNDYQRIFNTIYSVLQSINAEINHSCIYFSVIGSSILHEHYKLEPKVYMGIAAYMLDEKQQTVLAFAEKNEIRCSGNGFHSWIVVNDWMIDLTAPLFPNLLKAINKNVSCKPKMFQRPLRDTCASGADLRNNGDFYIHENIPFGIEMMDHFAKRPLNIDMVEVCCKWYRRPPIKMARTITVGNGAGDLKQVQLKSYNIAGSW